MTDSIKEIKNNTGAMPENKMGTQPINKLLIDMAWPAILSMTISALYNIVDSIFVGMISENALTAISIIGPVQMMIISVAVGSGVGINSLISRRLGAKRYEDANQAASTSIRIAAMNFAIWLILGLLFAEKFVHIYYQNGFIEENAIVYLKINCYFSLFINVQIALEKTLQATGNMKAPMIISLCGAITNVVLDPVFIFGLLGLPKLGVEGAAIATIIGQFVAMGVAIFIAFRGNHIVTIKIRGFKIDWRIVKDIYAVGLPSIVMQSLGSFLTIGYNAILAVYSETAVAVLGVYFRLQSFVFMPVFGLNQGAMPLMGFNYGAKNKKRLMDTYKYGLKFAIIFMGAGLLVFQLCPKLLLGMFSASTAMLELGVPALRIISICFLPAAFGILTSTVFQATGHGVYSLFSSLIRQLFCVLPLAYFLAKVGGVTLSWASFPLAEIVGTLYVALVFRYLYKKEIKNL